jgi:hypothetical protein
MRIRKNIKESADREPLTVEFLNAFQKVLLANPDIKETLIKKTAGLLDGRGYYQGAICDYSKDEIASLLDKWIEVGLPFAIEDEDFFETLRYYGLSESRKNKRKALKEGLIVGPTSSATFNARGKTSVVGKKFSESFEAGRSVRIWADVFGDVDEVLGEMISQAEYNGVDVYGSGVSTGEDFEEFGIAERAWIDVSEEAADQLCADIQDSLQFDDNQIVDVGIEEGEEYSF